MSTNFRPLEIFSKSLLQNYHKIATVLVDEQSLLEIYSSQFHTTPFAISTPYGFSAGFL